MEINNNLDLIPIAAFYGTVIILLLFYYLVY